MISQDQILSLMKKHFHQGTLNMLTDHHQNEGLSINSRFYMFLHDFETACRMNKELVGLLSQRNDLNNQIEYKEAEIARRVDSDDF